jgi:hypothetical protein
MRLFKVATWFGTKGTRLPPTTVFAFVWYVYFGGNGTVGATLLPAFQCIRCFCSGTGAEWLLLCRPQVHWGLPRHNCCHHLRRLLQRCVGCSFAMLCVLTTCAPLGGD